MSNTFKVKVSDLIGVSLDWAVAKAANIEIGFDANPESKTLWFDQSQIKDLEVYEPADYPFFPTESWEQAGPIIERHKISIVEQDHLDEEWGASAGTHTMKRDQDGELCTILYSEDLTYGGTQLIAAMRCFVKMKLGDEIELPNEMAEL